MNLRSRDWDRAIVGRRENVGKGEKPTIGLPVVQSSKVELVIIWKSHNSGLFCRVVQCCRQHRGVETLSPRSLGSTPLIFEWAVVLLIPLHCHDGVDVSLSFRPVERYPRRIDDGLLTS